MMTATAPVPSAISLHARSRLLEISYADGHWVKLPCEYLRVFSPSAEVRGHGNGEPLLVPGKREVGIKAIEPVGRYAVRLRFDDGHDTGLYSWAVLQELADHHDAWWARYLERLAEQGMTRNSDVVKLSALGVKKFTPSTGAMQ